jgi:ketosteroid isomerase-like protein
LVQTDPPGAPGSTSGTGRGILNANDRVFQGGCDMDIRETITQLYKDYESRNLTAVLNGLPDGFSFEWPFDPNTARYAGTCHSKAELLAQLNDVATSFQFNKYHATNILVDGDRAAAQVELDLTSLKTGRTFSATIAHFWWFEDGIPVRLVEYGDTALIANESFSEGETSSQGSTPS